MDDLKHVGYALEIKRGQSAKENRVTRWCSYTIVEIKKRIQMGKSRWIEFGRSESL